MNDGRRRLRAFLLTIVACCAAAGGIVLALGGGSVDRSPRKAAEPAGERAGGPESFADLVRMSNSAALRVGAGRPGELAAGLRAKRVLARKAAAEGVPGTGGSWAPIGNTPLIFDDPTYPAANGDGFGKVNGRVSDFAYDPASKTVYAAVAQGGVWATKDLGATWTSVGDGLPIGSTGSVGYTSGGGGTLIVSTGDHAFSNDYAGVGAYWSTDGGGHWTKAIGIPDGALSFRVRVDPNNPNVVYVATGFGLLRSTDAGRSFVDVKLPTGPCAGDSSKPNCFFANIVTDVAVQPADKLGHKGGAVMAAIGWRAGTRKNLADQPESPGQGIYRSDNGEPGTFSQVKDAGFTPPEEQGRVEFGVTGGSDQDSSYLYAIVQNSRLFNGQVSGGEEDIPLVGTPSVLDGIYVSTDFGKTWDTMESRQEFFNPANGSSLSSLTAAGIGPGYQVTYNQWMAVDPTRQLDGIPTRVLLGMEEVWQTTSTRTPQSGHSQFQAFGQYTANGGACLVIPEQCGTVQANKQDFTTTHPDQHSAILIPDGKGGLTLLVGNDGGVYRQQVDSNGEFNQNGWGRGANEGFHTLLPYGAAMAKDGTVYAGLQDNGEMKITPDGKQYAVYVGDGFFSVVDPDNSDIAYGELPTGIVYKTTNGGKSFTTIDPGHKEADFTAPLVMDPTNSKHLVSFGREVIESLKGPDTEARCGGQTVDTSPPACNDTDNSWKVSYDLGTAKHPGDAKAEADLAAKDPNNHATAGSAVGDAEYSGFCGGCDPVKLGQRFQNGVATNVGGSKPPKAGTGDGWHITAAKGLPNRLITSITSDPKNPRTVYVSLGASAARFWAPIGSEGEDASSAAGGHVYKSTDAGETFTDVSGDLPKVQATWVLLHGDQLVVGTAIGAFASRDTAGRDFVPLGQGLPPVAIYSMLPKPGDPNTLVVATFGRGVYRYSFADPASVPAAKPGCRDTVPPVSRIVHRKATRKGMTMSGTSSDRGCGANGRGVVKRVIVSLARARAKQCLYVSARGHFGKRRSCLRTQYFLKTSGTTRWALHFKHRLPKGSYKVWVRGYDGVGNVERKRFRRNGQTFRVR